MNKLITAIKRKNTSYAGGSTTDSYSLTDLFVSPEVKQDIRSFAYNPVTNASTDLPAGAREEIYRGGGTQEIYGVTIHDLVELGKTQKYQNLFTEFYSSNWNATNNELIIGLDLTKDAFVRPVARQAESGGTFTALPDDQFLARADKIGFYGFLEEGRACIDARAIAAVNIH